MTAGNVFQAIRCLGRQGVDDDTIRYLRRRLPGDVKSDLRRNLSLMTDWMRTVVDQIAVEA